MTFLPAEVIRKKRDGQAVTAEEIALMVRGLTDGSVSEGQVAAFAMVTLLKGLSVDERVALTLAMRDSGRVLQWIDPPGPVLDKHSTGGIGDCVSLMLAPMLAACGAYVPMISGRGLGHTGGTLDKLDSIPGYISQPDEALFRKTTYEVGCAIIAQTVDIAPADKRLYAIRDVTATVDSIDLITASILSKKLAAGLQGLVLDVKYGSGAFMTSVEKAKALAESLVDVACSVGCPTTALLTDMNEPLAAAAGNALEVSFTVDYLTGAHRHTRLHEVVLALGSDLLVTGGLATSIANARSQLVSALETGAAAERFAKMISALGGPSDLLEKPDRSLPKAPIVQDVKAPTSGYISSVDCRAIGLGVIGLGGGRTRADDEIDLSVGYSDFLPIGCRIERGDAIAQVHAATQTAADKAAEDLLKAVSLSEEAPDERPLLLERITAKAA